MENMIYSKKRHTPLYFERNPEDYRRFCFQLHHFYQKITPDRSPVFLCIGTDRMTGDCLGPLVGHKLKKYKNQTFPVFGTLEHPVHALNLQYVLTEIQLRFTNPYFIVIDAALGLPGHIGNITLSPNALLPGEGMKKHLPAIGDLSITGIVNSCHGDASLLLQNTRLYLVNELADFICTGLTHSFSF